MEKGGHSFLIISRNKEIEHYLLNNNNIPFIDRGKGSNSLIGKGLYFFKAIPFIYHKLIKFKPDILISFGTPYPAIVSKLIGKDHISINDTEHAKMHHLLTDPFSKYILTPSCYKKDLGPKQIQFNSYMELCYLHPKYFTPDASILSFLNIKKDEKFVIMRFVSWNASHDIGHSGLIYDMKYKAVKEFSKYAKVFITSEADLPPELKIYQIKIPPEKMHDVLFYASLLYGESATMASESACLGTPAIYLDNDGRGYTDEQEKKYNLVFNLSESIEDQVKSIKLGINILVKTNYKMELRENHKKLLVEKIDVTSFIVWFIENYPESVRIIRVNPDFQYNFR